MSIERKSEKKFTDCNEKEAGNLFWVNDHKSILGMKLSEVCSIQCIESMQKENLTSQLVIKLEWKRDFITWAMKTSTLKILLHHYIF